MVHIIDCAKISENWRNRIREETEELKKQRIIPSLAIVMNPDDPASKVYVRKKWDACMELGFNFQTSFNPYSVETFAERDDIHGVIVQLPVMDGYKPRAVISRIPPKKDVDCLTAENLGQLMLGYEKFIPCTPKGIDKILYDHCGKIAGANCVIIGRSDIVGKPLAVLLTRRNATVTLCHSRTKNLAEITRKADILVSAVGVAGFVTGEMVKDGAMVIDVGINRGPDGKLCGDVRFDEVAEKAGAITPVPGGVGLMTVTALMENTLIAAKNRF